MNSRPSIEPSRPTITTSRASRVIKRWRITVNRRPRTSPPPRRAPSPARSPRWRARPAGTFRAVPTSKKCPRARPTRPPASSFSCFITNQTVKNNQKQNVELIFFSSSICSGIWRKIHEHAIWKWTCIASYLFTLIQSCLYWSWLVFKMNSILVRFLKFYFKYYIFNLFFMW